MLIKLLFKNVPHVWSNRSFEKRIPILVTKTESELFTVLLKRIFYLLIELRA